MDLRRLARVSGIYDLLLGVPMLVAAPQLGAVFSIPSPRPLVNAQINGVFALALLLRRAHAGRGDAPRQSGGPALEERKRPGERLFRALRHGSTRVEARSEP